MINSSQLLNQFKKRPIVACGIAIILLAVVYIGLNAHSFGQGVNEGFIAKSNEVTAKMMNAKVPIKIDDLTTLVSVKVKSDGIQYNYKMSLSKDETEGDPEKVLKPDTAQVVCQDNNSRKVLNMGDIFYYSYVDKNDASLGEFKITKSDCN